MSRFNLKKASLDLNPRINGTSIEVYHRTTSQQVVGNVCETGFIAGGGAAHGVGIYTNYTLKSANQ